MQLRWLYAVACMVWLMAVQAGAQGVVWPNASAQSKNLTTQSREAVQTDKPALAGELMLPETPTSPMRTTSYVLLGSAGGATLLGTVFALMADNNHRDYKRRYSAGNDTRAVRADASPAAVQKLKDKINTQKTIAIVSLSVAGVAAVTGTALFFFAPEWQVKRNLSVGFAPTQGGALLSLQGGF